MIFPDSAHIRTEGDMIIMDAVMKWNGKKYLRIEFKTPIDWLVDELGERKE